jgi:uncharacterized MAPEG superfamily protein
MTTMTAWVTPRLPVIRAIAVGSGTWPIMLGLCWNLWPAMPAIEQPSERLLFAVQLAVAPAAILLLMVLSCMRLFDTDRAEDVFANAESMAWKINARVLQNSLEQAALFVPALVGLSIRIAPHQVKALPMLTAIWCVARLLYWIGYRIKLHYRALGFDWTFLTTSLAYGWFLYTLF